jgi:hypothetical protein
VAHRAFGLLGKAWLADRVVAAWFQDELSGTSVADSAFHLLYFKLLDILKQVFLLNRIG